LSEKLTAVNIYNEPKAQLLIKINFSVLEVGSTFGCFKPDSSVPYNNQELEGMQNCIGSQSPQQTVVLEQKKLLLKHFPSVYSLFAHSSYVL